MQPKLFLKPSLVLLSLLITFFSFGQRPFSDPIEGQFTSTFGGKIGKCKASSITFKYRLSTLSGEPTIYTNLKWENAYGTSTDCLSEDPFQMFIKVQVIYTWYWIPAQGSFGLVPKGDNTWGKNPLAGSPNWDELFLKSEPSKNSSENFIDASESKSIWKSGSLRVLGILIIDSNGNKTTIN